LLSKENNLKNGITVGRLLSLERKIQMLMEYGH
jgi:hypothetical protein